MVAHTSGSSERHVPRRAVYVTRTDTDGGQSKILAGEAASAVHVGADRPPVAEKSVRPSTGRDDPQEQWLLENVPPHW